MILLRELKVPIEKDNIRGAILKKLNIKDNDIISLKINKKSIDARRKPNLYYVYEVILELRNEELFLKKNKNKNVLIYKDEKFEIKKFGSSSMKYRPIVVGCGPAGLFCGYILAKYGYKPILIDRGSDIDKRVKDIDNFINNNKLDINSNVLFGLGGAGCFSDGKLNTLVKDKRHIGKLVFEVLVECGAPSEILYEAKPHIGTDLLRVVISNLKDKIIRLGGKFYFSCLLTDIIVKDNKLIEIEVNNEKRIPTNNLILSIGHSARDTFLMLNKRGLNMQSKPFAVGIRIQHNQEVINKSQYGTNYKKLPPASYKLTYKTKNKRAVYSFCMCPGGYVINSSSEKNMLCINGMSNHKRDSKNANSAIVVSVNNKDYGDELFSGMNYQRKLESKAYEIGSGLIPTQRYQDYKENKKTTCIKSVDMISKGNYTLSNINDIFNDDINEALKEAIDYFGTKIKGFNDNDAIICAVEARTSSPIRILRDDNYLSNIKGIYPCGEGSGYAGGITTSAMDGVRIAEAIISEYKNEDII